MGTVENLERMIMLYIRRTEEARSGPANATRSQIRASRSVNSSTFDEFGRWALDRLLRRGELVGRWIDGEPQYSSPDPPDPPEFLQEKLFDPGPPRWG